MPKRKIKAKTSPKVKEKAKRKYSRKMMYKCVNKSEMVVTITFQEDNEFGAKNNVTKQVPYYLLKFSYFLEINRALNVNDAPPSVISASFEIQTSNKEVYNKYNVGEEYKELPINA